MLNIASNQITQRFAAMLTVTEKFSVLNSVNLSRLDEHETLEAATRLKQEYSNDLSEAFPMQLVSYKASLKADINKASSIKQLAQMLIVEYGAVLSVFAVVLTALLLFLTLPVTVASAERSFSKLKIIIISSKHDGTESTEWSVNTGHRSKKCEVDGNRSVDKPFAEINTSK